MLTSILFILTLLSSAFSVIINNTIYIVSNAERPSLDRAGLTPIGFQRASQCIPSLSVLGNVNIGAIVVCTPTLDTGFGCIAANTTAAPLAEQLGLVPDTSCITGEQEDDDCVRDLMTKYAGQLNSNQSILIVWDATVMDDLLEHLEFDLPNDQGADGNDVVDDDALRVYPDIILIKNGGGDDSDEDKTVIVTSMNCTGIDGQQPGTFPVQHQC